MERFAGATRNIASRDKHAMTDSFPTWATRVYVDIQTTAISKHPAYTYCLHADDLISLIRLTATSAKSATPAFNLTSETTELRQPSRGASPIFCPFCYPKNFTSSVSLPQWSPVPNLIKQQFPRLLKSAIQSLQDEAAIYTGERGFIYTKLPLVTSFL